MYRADQSVHDTAYGICATDGIEDQKPILFGTTASRATTPKTEEVARRGRAKRSREDRAANEALCAGLLGGLYAPVLHAVLHPSRTDDGHMKKVMIVSHCVTSFFDDEAALMKESQSMKIPENKGQPLMSILGCVCRDEAPLQGHGSGFFTKLA